MRALVVIFLSALIICSCDDSRVYEKNYDFDDRKWTAENKPEFEFDISDTVQSYNLYCNVRNSLVYPYSRLFLNYSLEDSTGRVAKQDLVNKMLFDPKTGKPEGTSGLGDIYDHRVVLLRNYKFPYRGKHKLRVEQQMRIDTLSGILAVGVRVEKSGQAQ